MERFLVDYIKLAIKDANTPSNLKFQALLLIKEVSKGKSPRLVNYMAKKIVPRLTVLANSSLKEQCLREFNKNAEANYSARFYQLLLECFQNWGGMFKDINSIFFKVSRELYRKKRIPVTSKYWGLPAETTTQPSRREASPDYSAVYNRSADHIEYDSRANTSQPLSRVESKIIDPANEGPAGEVRFLNRTIT